MASLADLIRGGVGVGGAAGGLKPSAREVTRVAGAGFGNGMRGRARAQSMMDARQAEKVRRRVLLAEETRVVTFFLGREWWIGSSMMSLTII